MQLVMFPMIVATGCLFITVAYVAVAVLVIEFVAECKAQAAYERRAP